MENRAVRVLLASANPDVLRMLAEVARDEPGTQIVAEAANAIQAAALSHSLRPNVVLVDAELPHISASNSLRLSRIGGLDAAIGICQEIRNTTVVVLSNWREALSQRTSDEQRMELSLYRETVEGSSRITLTDLVNRPVQENPLVFAGLVARETPRPRRRLLEFCTRTIPLSILGIIGGLVLMLIVVQPAAGLVLAMIGGLGLFVSLAVKTIAARLLKPHAGDLEREVPGTEKREATTDDVEASAKRMSRV